MHYTVAENKNNHREQGLKYDPFKALISPRPIGWISSMSKKGEVNIAPYSFFNAFSDRPHIVGFSSNTHKDALVFAQETGEFTCSLVTYDLRFAMNDTSAPLPRGKSEFDHAKLETAPSINVKPPRVKLAPASLECKYLQTIPMTSLDGTTAYYLVLGQVVGVYIDDSFINNGMVETAKMDIIARGGYNDYFRINETNQFEITRPTGAGNFNEPPPK